MKTYAVAPVGDYDSSVPAHRAIPIALELAAKHHGIKIDATWFGTARIGDAETELAPFHGVWCVPASPYANFSGALDTIRVARERHLPFLGTCGGFQHALIEYFRNVLGVSSADHAESNPDAVQPVITKLTCSLVEKQGELLLEAGSLLHISYGESRTREEYRCSYGPNPLYESTLAASEFRITARDLAGEIRGGELRGHPFFVGTLFQPERRALNGQLPPVVREFAAALMRPKSLP